MLKRLHQLFLQANQLQPDEDSYSFKLVPQKDGTWSITVDHSYVNKSVSHPVACVFRGVIDDTNLEEVCEKIKTSFIERARQLCSLRAKHAQECLERYRRANEDLTNRIVHLEELKEV